MWPLVLVPGRYNAFVFHSVRYEEYSSAVIWILVNDEQEGSQDYTRAQLCPLLSASFLCI
jgi:hypothetical protein